MVATTEEKARLFDLLIGVGELVRDGNRDAGQVAEVLQIIKNERKFAALLLRGVGGTSITAQPLLLDPVGTITLSATNQQFVVRENFIKNTNKQTKVKIARLGSNFESWFLGKVEEPMDESILRYAKLRGSSVDVPIIVELGGEEHAETSLTEIFCLMALQPNGEEGALLNDGWVNIFYVRDASLVLRAVGVHWFENGWYVISYPIDGPFAWLDNRQVFSSNS